MGDLVEIVGDLGERRMLVPGGDLIGLKEVRAYREAVVLAPTSLDRFVTFVKMYRLRLHREPSTVQRVLGTFAVRRAPSKHDFGKLVGVGRQRASLDRCWTPVPLQRHSNCHADTVVFNGKVIMIIITIIDLNKEKIRGQSPVVPMFRIFASPSLLQWPLIIRAGNFILIKFRSSISIGDWPHFRESPSTTMNRN